MAEKTPRKSPSSGRSTAKSVKSGTRTRKTTTGSAKPAAGRTAAKGKAKTASTVEKQNYHEICQLIAERAYYKAEARNFAAGDPVQDWLEAEAEIKKSSAA